MTVLALICEASSVPAPTMGPTSLPATRKSASSTVRVYP